MAAIALEGLEAEHIPKRHVRDGVDAGSIYIVTAERPPLVSEKLGERNHW